MVVEDKDENRRSTRRLPSLFPTLTLPVEPGNQHPPFNFASTSLTISPYSIPS